MLDFLKKKKAKTARFAERIPAFVSGMTGVDFEFTDPAELINHERIQSRLNFDGFKEMRLEIDKSEEGKYYLMDYQHNGAYFVVGKVWCSKDFKERLNKLFQKSDSDSGGKPD